MSRCLVISSRTPSMSSIICYHQSLRQRVDSEPEPMIERCQLPTKIPLHGKRSLVACLCWTLIESWVFYLFLILCVFRIIYFVFCNSRAVVTWKIKLYLLTYLLTARVIIKLHGIETWPTGPARRLYWHAVYTRFGYGRTEKSASKATREPQLYNSTTLIV